MGTDDLHRKNRSGRRKRKEATRAVKKLRVLIVCEGKKTEPNYLKPLKEQINRKYRENFLTLKCNCIDVRNR